jgi:hypothetical protein
VANTAVYRREPDLFGLMEVREVRADGRIVCRVDPERDDVPSYEIFEAGELDVTVRFEVAA